MEVKYSGSVKLQRASGERKIERQNWSLKELIITGIIEENYFTWKKIIFKIEIFCQKKKEFNEKIPILRDIPTHGHTAIFFLLKISIKHSGYT